MTARMPTEDPAKQEVTRCISELLTRRVTVEKCFVCVCMYVCVCVKMCVCVVVYTYATKSYLYSIFIWFFSLQQKHIAEKMINT